MAYVDGFLLAVPRRKLADYRRVARAAGKIWMEFGALDYMDSSGVMFDMKRMAYGGFKSIVSF